MQDTLISYIRDEDNNPHGCIVGTLVDDTVQIAFSVCTSDPESDDRFDKARALQIAKGRIAAGRNSATRKEDLVDELDLVILSFRGRCARYFKTTKTQVIGVDTAVATV